MSIKWIGLKPAPVKVPMPERVENQRSVMNYKIREYIEIDCNSVEGETVKDKSAAILQAARELDVQVIALNGVIGLHLHLRDECISCLSPLGYKIL